MALPHFTLLGTVCSNVNEIEGANAAANKNDLADIPLVLIKPYTTIKRTKKEPFGTLTISQC